MNDDKRIVQMQQQILGAVNAAHVPASVTVLVLENVLVQARKLQEQALAEPEKERDKNAQRHNATISPDAGH